MSGYPQNQYPQQGDGNQPPHGQPQYGYPPQPGYDPYAQQQTQYNPYGYAGQPQQYGMGPAGLPAEAFGGFWMRVAAYIVDAIILFIPSLLIMIAVHAALGVEMAFGASAFDQTPGQQLAGNMSNLASIALGWAYFTFFTVNFGGTPGKLALGLRVVGEDGAFIGVGRATGRYFAEILSACLLLIGYIMVAFHPQKRGLHDLICGTYVVKKEHAQP